MSPKRVRASGLPLTFISFGYTSGRILRKPQEPKETVLAYKPARTAHHGDIAYGALFVLSDFEFHLQSLDALEHSTSTITSGVKEHYTTRSRATVTPIAFDTLEQFSRLLYTEKESVIAEVYYANPNHPKIINSIRRLKFTTVKHNINAEAFKELYWEVKTHGTIKH